MYLNRKDNRHTFFLGVFILLFSIEYIMPITHLLKIGDYYPQLKRLPFDFRWLLFSLFYIYVRDISVFPYSKKVYCYLIPGIIAFLLNLNTYFGFSDFVEQIWSLPWFDLLYYKGEIFYSTFIAIKTFLFINKHTKKVEMQYVYTITKELEWAKWFVLSGIIFTLIMNIRLFVNNFYLDLIESLINVGFLYWISIHGIRQRKIVDLFQEKEENVEKEDDKGKKNLREATSSDILLFDLIEKNILEKRLHKNPDLNINNIAIIIGEHPKRISNAINTVSNKNFKTYINSLRIKDAIVMLQNDGSKDFSIEGISLEVGFKSKSTFYDAFKKETGTTPLNYKEI